MSWSRWRWGVVVGALLLAWGGCLFNPQPEPPAAADSLPSEGGAGGTGAYNGLGGGTEGEGGDMADGLWAGGELGSDRIPVGGAGGSGGAGGVGGGGGQGPTGGSGGST